MTRKPRRIRPPGGQTEPADAALELLQHGGLDVDGDHPAGRTYSLRRRNGEAAGTATGVQHLHAGLHARALEQKLSAHDGEL